MTIIFITCNRFLIFRKFTSTSVTTIATTNVTGHCSSLTVGFKVCHAIPAFEKLCATNPKKDLEGVYSIIVGLRFYVPLKIINCSCFTNIFELSECPKNVRAVGLIMNFPGLPVYF